MRSRPSVPSPRAAEGALLRRRPRSHEQTGVFEGARSVLEAIRVPPRPRRGARETPSRVRGGERVLGALPCALLRPRAGAVPRLELVARAIPERPRGPGTRRFLRRTTSPSRTGPAIPFGGLSSAAPREPRILLGLARALRHSPRGLVGGGRHGAVARPSSAPGDGPLRHGADVLP